MTRRGLTVLVLAVVACLFAAGGVALWTANTAFDPDARDSGHADALARLPECGIGQQAFAKPTRATGEGFQEYEWRFTYEDLDQSWVDHNVLKRFGVTDPIEEMRFIEGSERITENLSWDAPASVTRLGKLVYQSPFGESEMGSALFDVYRSATEPTRYGVEVTCRNRNGINYTPANAAVPTSAPN